jgi:hypothetical protein
VSTGVPARLPGARLLAGSSSSTGTCAQCTHTTRHDGRAHSNALAAALQGAAHTLEAAAAAAAAAAV